MTFLLAHFERTDAAENTIILMTIAIRPVLLWKLPPVMGTTYTPNPQPLSSSSSRRDLNPPSEAGAVMIFDQSHDAPEASSGTPLVTHYDTLSQNF